eukprot:NODE_520_length_6539_cov_0.561801.p3 type:complete len:102 gc:universal NODE_520_length_6539_cov_0.561801:611-306(-)
MDDNAKQHCTDECLESMASLGIKTLVWPPYSPDLNIIENMWSVLKSMVYAKGKKYDNEEQICEEINRCMEILKNDLELFKKLYESMPGRAKACIKAYGGHF